MKTEWNSGLSWMRKAEGEYMFRRKKTSITAIFMILASVSIVLSGCNSDNDLILAEGTEDQQLKLVAEYAAGLLMKYDKSHKNGLTVIVPELPVEEDPVDISPPTPAEQEIMQEEGLDPSVNVSGGGSDGEAGGMGGPEEGMPEGNMESIAAALGIPDFDVVFTGYETTETYPEQDISADDAMLFSLQSEEGEKLLILHFDLSNNTGADTECRPINSDVKIRLLVNDETRLNQQMTILMNDLKSYDAVMPAGATEDTVLVFYIDDSLVDSIESLTLLIIGEEGESRFQL